MNVNSIPLETGVDINSLDSIHTDQNISFTKKNTLKFQDLLSNYRETKGEGQYTTLGNTVKPTSKNGSTVSFNNGQFSSSATYVALDTKLLTMPISGILRNEAKLFVSNGKPYYQNIIEQNGTLYHSYYDIEADRWNTAKLGVSEAFVLNKEGKYIEANSNTSYTLKDSITRSTIKTFTVTNAPSKANNGRIIGNTMVIGRDDDNQRLAWHSNITGDTNSLTSYQGLIDTIGGKIVVTGEPYYSNLSSSVLTNGIIRWTTKTITGDNTNITSFNNNLTCELPLTYEDINACSGDSNASALTNVINNYCTTSLIVASSYSNNTKTNYCTNNSSACSVVINDPNMSPGNFWNITNASQYDSVFPYRYTFTNVATNRGSTFDYGRGWSTSFSQTIEPRIYHACSKLLYPTLGYCPLNYVVFNGSLTNYKLDNTVNNSSTCCKLPWSPNTNQIAYSSVDVTHSGKRHRLVDFNTKENQAWDDFYHSIGGRNSGDETIIDNIPFSFNDGKFDRLIYNGLFSAVSLNGVLLNSTSSNGIEQFSWTESGDNLYVLINGQLSHLKKNYSLDDIKIKKLADYIFTTNLIGYYNTFIEDKNGKLNLVNAYIPYQQTFKLNDAFQRQGYFSPTSSTNDIWYQAAGYNTNADDNDRVTSYILPQIELPIYVDNNNLDSFNKTIIDNNQPLLSLDRSYVDSKTKLDVYYTHSLSSTDLSYKYSNKDSKSYFDKELLDNTWWTTSSLYLYPLGMLSVVNGINNITPTIDLDDDYSVRFYSKNNNIFLSFNPTQAVYQSNIIFTIYTSSYYFDGQAIYYIGGTNDNTSNSFVCYALGMKFLGNSGTEAFFYSPYDKAIYLFSGSNTLTLYKYVAQLGNILDTCFSSLDQALYILDDKGQLLQLEAETSALFDIADPDHLELSANGIVAYDKSNEWKVLSPHKGELTPLLLETEWIGNYNMLYNFAYIDIMLYKKEKAFKLKVTLSTQADNDTVEDVREINISPSDFTGINYRLRITPKNNRGNAFKFRIESEDDVSISNISLALDQASAAQAARTKHYG